MTQTEDANPLVDTTITKLTETSPLRTKKQEECGTSTKEKEDSTWTIEQKDDDTWTGRDRCLLLLAGLVYFGDAVEIYLPGVIVQAVSCDLHLTHTQEGLVAVTMYATLALATIIGARLSQRFGRGPIILASLYTSVIVTVLCAVVPSYYTLLLSRALLGMCAGLKISTVGVYFAQHVSCRSVSVLGTFVASLLYSAGGTWVAFLGFLLLERMGWRVLVLCTSIPLFLPPIAIMHYLLYRDRSEIQDGISPSECQDNDQTVVHNFKMRTLKSSLLSFIIHAQGYCLILLLPSLLQLDNARKTGGDECETVVHGSQFLVLALVTGGGNIAGRLAGYWLSVSLRLPFRCLQSCLAVIILLSYSSLLLHPDIVVTVVAMGLAKFTYSMMMAEFDLLCFDPRYFGKDNFVMGSGLTVGLGMTGALMGIVVVAFLKPIVAVSCMVALSCVLVPVVCFVTER